MCFPDEAYGNKRITCITKQLLLFFLPGVALTCVVEQRVDPRRAGMSVLAIILAIFTRPLANHLRVFMVSFHINSLHAFWQFFYYKLKRLHVKRVKIPIKYVDAKTLTLWRLIGG